VVDEQDGHLFHADPSYFGHFDPGRVGGAKEEGGSTRSSGTHLYGQVK